MFMRISLTAKPVIRQAGNRDLEFLVYLLELLFKIEEDFHWDRQKQRKGMELLLSQDNAAVFVAENNESVIGMATVQLIISTAEGGPAMLVEDVIILPEYRGQGIGSKLLFSVGQWGYQRGAKRMQLLADKTNTAALHFYKAEDWKGTKLICLRKYFRE